MRYIDFICTADKVNCVESIYDPYVTIRHFRKLFFPFVSAVCSSVIYEPVNSKFQSYQLVQSSPK